MGDNGDHTQHGSGFRIVHFVTRRNGGRIQHGRVKPSMRTAVLTLGSHQRSVNRSFQAGLAAVLNRELIVPNMPAQSDGRCWKGNTWR